MRVKATAAMAMAVAVLASLAWGPDPPPKRPNHWQSLAQRTPRAIPSVARGAIEKGCAAWGEKLADCTRAHVSPSDQPYRF